MAQNVVIAGATYNDVPSVNLITANGSTANFVDTSDANAIANDILQGKTAYVDGEKIVGTGSGGGMVIHGDLIDCYADEPLDSGEFVYFKTGAKYDKSTITLGSYQQIEFLDDEHIITYNYDNKSIQIHEFSTTEGIINSGTNFILDESNIYITVYDSTHVIVTYSRSNNNYSLLLELDLDNLTIQQVDYRDIFGLSTSYKFLNAQVCLVILDDFIIFSASFKKGEYATTYYVYARAAKIVNNQFTFYTSYELNSDGWGNLYKYNSNKFICGYSGTSSQYSPVVYEVSSSGAINRLTGYSNYQIASYYSSEGNCYIKVSTNHYKTSTQTSIGSIVNSSSNTYGTLAIESGSGVVKNNKIKKITSNNYLAFITDSSRTYIFNATTSQIVLLDTINKNKCAISPIGAVLLYSPNNISAYILTNIINARYAYKHSTSTSAYGITATSAQQKGDPIQAYIPHV